MNGQPVLVMADATRVEGVARGVDAEGALLVERGHETIHCHSGDVSVRVAHG